MGNVALELEPLTAEAFTPYGDVIEVSADNNIVPINYGLTERHHDLARVDVADDDGHAIISLFRTQPVTLPFQVTVMERHPLGSQTFIMLSGNPYIVIVAEAGEFDCTKLRAFTAQPHQGVNYHKGTWHHYCLVPDSASDFAVIDRGCERESDGDNCDELTIPSDLNITVNSRIDKWQ